MRKPFLFSIMGLSLVGFIVWLSIKFDDENSATAAAHSSQPKDETESRKAETDGSIGSDLQAEHESVWEQRIYPERLQVADVDMPLLFVGQIDNELKQVVLAGMHLIYGHSTGHSYYDPIKKISVNVDGRILTAQGRGIQFDGPGIYRPEEFGEVFGAIITTNGQENVAVTEPLIESYRAAWERRTEHAVAYRKLEEFVALMSDVWAGTALESDLPPTMNDLFHPASEAVKRKLQKEGSQGPKSFMAANRMGKGARWRMPSLLEIVEDYTGRYSEVSADRPSCALTITSMT